MAGVSETVLGLRDAGEVTGAIEKCWARLDAPETASYLARFGIAPDSLAVAIAVQEMVDARSAFVVFSADPVGGTENVVVAAASGLGEGLVQERSDAHHYFVSPANRVVHAGDPAGQPLTEREVQEVADLARKVAAELGRAQDIEGAIDQDGRIWLLQSRPMVAPSSSHRTFTNLNVTESFPGLSSPLTFSVAARFYESAFGDNYRRFGVSGRRLAGERDALHNMLAYINGRVFYDLTSFYRLHSLSPFFPLIRSGWEKKVGITRTRDRLGGGGRRSTRPSVLGFALMTWTALVSVLANGRRMRLFESYWSERLPAAQRELLDLRQPTERTEHYLTLWSDVSTSWGVTLVNDTLANTLYGVCRALLSPLAAGNVDGLLAGLLVPPVQTLTDEFWRSCALSVSGADRAADERQLSELIAARGDICFSGLKLEEPCLSERLDWLHDSAPVRDQQAPEPATPPAKAGLSPGRRLRWWLAAWLASRLRRLIAHRENHRYLRSQLFAYCRKFILGVAPDLRRLDVITDPADIWNLTDAEAIGALAGHGVALGLARVAEVRKHAISELGAIEPPAEFMAVGPVLDRRWQPVSYADKATSVIKGIGSAPGIARGRARLLTSPADAAGVSRDTIVIAQATDPSWIGVMAAAGGLVVERGSMLSHTAITGRLLGLPTVVCARDAAQLISDGELIEVDGTAGEVRIIDRDADS